MKAISKLFVLAATFIIITASAAFAAAGKIVSIYPSGQVAVLLEGESETLDAKYMGKNDPEIDEIVEVEKLCFEEDDCIFLAFPRFE